MKVEVKTNGYEAAELQDMISTFNKAAEKLFPECEVRHFYYGDRVDMLTVWLAPHGHYAHFNIRKDSVHFDGHECSADEYEKFTRLTHNDPLFKGKLFEIAAN